MIGPPARRPCPFCPYRRDVPSGVWHRGEYEKLRRYDVPTQEQPSRVFLCHLTPERVCAGWAGCHDGDHLLALRVAAMKGTMSIEDIEAVVDYVSPVPLFTSGAEAAKHGQAEITDPDERAIEAMSKIARVRNDLR